MVSNVVPNVVPNVVSNVNPKTPNKNPKIIKLIQNNDQQHPDVWYLVKEKQIDLYKDWGIRIIH
jgi:hypothetical protein